MPNLINEQNFDLRIGKILGTEPYQAPSDKSKTMYAHKFLLYDEEVNEYPVQISDTTSKQNYGNVGDLITVYVKAYSQGIYSVKYVATKEVAPKMDFDDKKPSNPIMAGTAAAVALNASVNWFNYHEEKVDDDVISRADMYFNWLVKKS